MVKTNLYDESSSRSVVETKGIFSVVEYDRDISVSPEMAQEAYFAAAMNVKKRQLVANLSDDIGVFVQAGEMQILFGDIEVGTGIKSAGDLFKKVISSSVTDETVVKPYYRGTGQLVLEPTFNHIILEDLSMWEEGLVIEDGMFLACEETVDIKVKPRTTVSSAIFGGEGLFNTNLVGKGLVAMESPVPKEELIIAEINDDVVKIDGNMAIAWSPSLKFTVQKSTKTLIGSAVSGEGLVNVYEGTGKVLIAPVRRNRGISAPDKQN